MSPSTLFRRFALIGLSTLITGCIPWRFSGYRPEGSGALESGYCVAGIKDRLRLHVPHDVDVLLYAAENTEENTIQLDVNLEIPDGVAVRILSPALLLESPEWTDPRSLVIDRITGGKARTYKVSDALPGSSQESLGRFTIWFMPDKKGTLWETEIPVTRSFTVKLPVMSANDENFEVDPVTFEAYSEWGMYTCAQ